MMTRGQEVWSHSSHAAKPFHPRWQGPGYQAPHSPATVVELVRRNEEACRAQAEGSHRIPEAERQLKGPSAGGRSGQESEDHILIALAPE